jgi:tetratricopeptide (TPR) repeat protein
MKIFLSYASEQSELAKEIALALRAEDHTVFFDRSALAPGETYNAEIREAIENSHLVVFLISPQSVTKGRYTLTELEFTEHKWPKPWGHVLPVMVMPTAKADIPPYLRAGTILQPAGNIAATVAAAVNRIPRPAWLRLFQRYRAPLLVFLSLTVASAGAVRWYQQAQGKRAELMQLYSQAKVQQESGNYEVAWKHFEQARSLAPNNPEVQEKEAKLAMTWLENVRITNGKGSFWEIVDQVLPALSRCSVSPDKLSAANCLAHMGWGDFLKSREGQRGLKPEQFYQQALALDPENPYAHVLWGFHILTSNGSPDEAKGHFERALASDRERPYVRAMQIAAWLYNRGHPGEDEAIRVINDIRRKGEPLPPGDETYNVRWSELWNIYYERIIYGYEPQSFLTALSPPDHPATFMWAFPEALVPESKRVFYQFILGSLQEHAGDYTRALTTFQSMQNSWAKELGYARLLDKTTEAITRLTELIGTGKAQKMASE